MKVEVVQTGAPLVTGNYDITGATPNGDMKGAIITEGTAPAISNGNNVSSYHWSIGATDLTSGHDISLAMAGLDATATASAAIVSMLSTTSCLNMPAAPTSTTPPVGNYSSTLTNGIRLNLTKAFAGSNRAQQTMLFSGGDFDFACGGVQFAAGDTVKTITHGLGGTPDVLILLTSLNQNGTDTQGYGGCIGFWDRMTAGSSSISFMAVSDAAGSTVCAEYCSNNSTAEFLNATGTSTLAHQSVSSVGGTTFAINYSANPGAPSMVGWIALCGIATQMTSKNLLASLPTATGVNTLVSGMTATPQVVFTIPTRAANGNTVLTDDSSGGFGIGMLATNDYVPANTTSAALAATWQDGVATSVGRTMFNVNVGGLISTNTGANQLTFDMTGGTWDAGGVSPHFPSVGASAFQAAVLAFGMVQPPAQSLYPFARTQFFTEDRVTFF